MGINSLFNRIHAIKRQLAPIAKTWFLQLEEGEEPSNDFRAMLGPHDTLVIREYPRGYLDNTDMPSQIERATPIHN